MENQLRKTPVALSVPLFPEADAPVVTWLDGEIDLLQFPHVLRSAVLFGSPELVIRLSPVTEAPSFPLIRLLTERVGIGYALLMSISGAALSAAESRSVGLLDHIDSKAGFDDWIAGVLANSPYSQQLALEMLRTQATTGNATAEAAEQYAFALSFTLPDSVEGIAAFLSKRKPHFSR